MGLRKATTPRVERGSRTGEELEEMDTLAFIIHVARQYGAAMPGIVSPYLFRLAILSSPRWPA